MEVSELQQLSSVTNNDMYTALEILMKKGRIEKGPEGQPFFSYISSDGVHRVVILSAEGIAEGERMVQHLVHPWYYKLLDAFRAIYVATVEGIKRALTRQ